MVYPGPTTAHTVIVDVFFFFMQFSIAKIFTVSASVRDNELGSVAIKAILTKI